MQTQTGLRGPSIVDGLSLQRMACITEAALIENADSGADIFLGSISFLLQPSSLQSLRAHAQRKNRTLCTKPAICSFIWNFEHIKAQMKELWVNHHTNPVITCNHRIVLVQKPAGGFQIYPCFQLVDSRSTKLLRIGWRQHRASLYTAACRRCVEQNITCSCSWKTEFGFSKVHRPQLERDGFSSGCCVSCLFADKRRLLCLYAIQPFSIQIFTGWSTPWMPDMGERTFGDGAIILERCALGT